MNMRPYLIICLLFITACGGNKGAEQITIENATSPEQLYEQAASHLDNEEYEEAVEFFKEVERIYPYSDWAIKAQLMAAYTNFKNEVYDDALIDLEHFIKLHPGHKDVAYAYYLRSLCYYEQISPVNKDQSYSELSKVALQDVVTRFPKTNYARDAKIKLELVYDHLAGKEVEVGRFYLSTSRYSAAINRFKNVVDYYQTTSHTPEALHRLVEAYIALGVMNEAQKYAAVLGHNYPNSKWYRNSFKLMKGKGQSIRKYKEVPVESAPALPKEPKEKPGSSIWKGFKSTF